MYEKLTDSFKRRYPFRVSCPSYIYPEGYSENLTLLSPFVDEIELLFFEGNTPEFLPDKKEIEIFSRISQSKSLSYNIHLPTDLSVTDKNHGKAVSNILEIVNRVESLNPSTYTLHLPYEADEKPDSSWYETAFGSLEKISDRTGKEKISVETLNYDPFFLEEIVREGYSLCLDAGHVMLYGFDLSGFYEKFKENITIMHLHGIKRDGIKHSDHNSLSYLNQSEAGQIKDILSSFKGVLSIEVFSFEKLKSSLKWIKENIPQTI